MKQISIGIDIGGTFTDIIIQDKETGRLHKQIKVATTPKNPEEAIIQSLNEELTNEEKPNVKQLYHATTIATNAFLGQVKLELPKSALITTKGFRDVLEIGRQCRAALYDFFFERPSPIIPRRYRFEISERIDSQGQVLLPLQINDLDAIIETIRKEEVNSIAISLLHSYRNANHEKEIKNYLKKKLGDFYLSASYEVSPEHREFERTSTTAINAVLMPIVSRYVKSLTDSFTDLQIDAPLFIMQSNGGVSKSEQIQQLPVSIIESGPSAGVVASRFLAEFLDLPNLLSFDMGGTTAKAGTIINEAITLTSEYEVGGEVHSGRIKKGSGYPARFPFIDLAEISSGGGSIAWVDQGNALKVGPISAGSDPGPACYGRNGENPTITDANLYFGRLNPKGLLDKTFPIHPDLAEKSIKQKVSALLNLDTIESTLGIIKIANINMSRILRIVTIERGLDPRDFVLLAFGGAGPLHSCALASELEIKEIIVPNNPGLFSTMGLLYTDAKHTYVKSIRKKLADIDYKELETFYGELQNKGSNILKEEGFIEKNMVHQRFVDLRYSGQGFELLIPISDVNLNNKNGIEQLYKLFCYKHKAIYGYVLDDEEIEMVNIRINSIGVIKKPTLTKITKGKQKPLEEAHVETRDVYFEQLKDFKPTPILNRGMLEANNVIVGPVIIEQYDTTTVVPPGWKASIDVFGLIHLTRK